MAEFEDGGVQRLPLESFQRLRRGCVPLAPIDRVANYRAANMGEMDAHLLGPAGPELCPYQARHRLEPRPQALFQRLLRNRRAGRVLAPRPDRSVPLVP